MKNFGTTWSEYHMMTVMEGDRPTVWGFCAMKVGEWISPLICRLFGHKWEDRGFAGPESGCVAMECTRCGYSEPTIWLY